MVEQAKPGPGRPENKIPPIDVTLPVDPITLKMLDALKNYGRFGRTRQEVILFIIRVWFWEHEDRLRSDISRPGNPLGVAANHDPDVE